MPVADAVAADAVANNAVVADAVANNAVAADAVAADAVTADAVLADTVCSCNPIVVDVGVADVVVEGNDCVSKQLGQQLKSCVNSKDCVSSVHQRLM